MDEQPSLLQRATASLAATARLPPDVGTASGDEGVLLRTSAALCEHRLDAAVVEVQSLTSVHARHILQRWLALARKRLEVEQACRVRGAHRGGAAGNRRGGTPPPAGRA